MLHPVKPVTCLPEMNKLLEFQRGVLELGIAIAKGDTTNDETGFKRILGSVAGAWFWERCKEGSKTWSKYLKRFVNTCKKHPKHSQKLLDIFDHDKNFETHLSDNSYSFQYPLLPIIFRKGIRPLLEFFYHYFASTGFGSEIHNKQGFTLTREAFLIAYQDINANKSLRVCPICDADFPDVNAKNIPDCELDHFFPKSSYPMLSIHPFNLIPACNSCNSKRKGKKDPLKNGKKPTATTGSFTNTYHPTHGRSIRDLGKILISRINSTDRFNIEIEDNYLLPHDRIGTAKRIYDLPERWNRRINHQQKVIKEIIERVIDQSIRRDNPTTIKMLEDLQLEHNYTRVSEQANHYLRSAYFSYVFQSSDEQVFLYHLVYAKKQIRR
jgi:hypothetical protein